MKKSDAGVTINYNFFSNLEVDLDKSFDTRVILPPKSIDNDSAFYSNAEKLAREIEILSGSSHYIVINRNFIFGDFIEALIVEKNYLVKTLNIATLSLGEDNVDSLANLLNGGFVDQLNLIVADYWYSNERINLVPYIYEELDKENKFQLAVACSHCKICTIETHCGKKISMHGSANLRSSANIEQFQIDEGSIRHDFNNDHIIYPIIELYKTIRKRIPKKQLWSVINGG